MVSKAEFVQELGALLKKTRAFSDLERIEYVEDRGSEIVRGYFSCDRVLDAYVTYDSNIAIITDVIRQWR